VEVRQQRVEGVPYYHYRTARGEPEVAYALWKVGLNDPDRRIHNAFTLIRILYSGPQAWSEKVQDIYACATM
jgi:hypothetical protein